MYGHPRQADDRRGPAQDARFSNLRFPSHHNRSFHNRQPAHHGASVNTSLIGVPPRPNRPPGGSNGERMPRNPVVSVDFKTLPLPLGDVSLDPERPSGTPAPAGASAELENPAAPGQNGILADNDRVFFHCIRFVDKTSALRDHNYSFNYRDEQDRLIKTSVIVGDPDNEEAVRRNPLERGMRAEEPADETHSSNIFDPRLESAALEAKRQASIAKQRVLDWLGDIVAGPWDTTNLKRIRFLCASLQMYDTAEDNRSPGEVALFEFSFQNGIIDTFHSFVRSTKKLVDEELHRLAQFEPQNKLDARMAKSGPRAASVAYELFCRLQPVEAATRHGDRRGLYAAVGFRDLMRSILPNLTPHLAQLQWNRTNKQCPILGGPWGARWILALDHELPLVLDGFTEMMGVLEETNQIHVNTDRERFVPFSAFVEALAEFLDVRPDAELVAKARRLGTAGGRDFDELPAADRRCTFHEGADSFCCAFNAVLGMCATLDRSFRALSHNEMMPPFKVAVERARLRQKQE